ncbi:MAG: hypothetical protein ACLVJH_17830 [Faecalibacterium prausnitzii]
MPPIIKGTLDLGEYQGVDYIRTQDGLVCRSIRRRNLEKRTSDLVRTDSGHDAAILSVDGELTGFAFDGSGDLWLSILTPGGGSLCRAAHDSWGTAVEQVVTQIDGAPLGACLSGGSRAGRQDLLCCCCQCQCRGRAGEHSAHRTAGPHRHRLRVCIRPGSTHGAEGAGRWWPVLPGWP